MQDILFDGVPLPLRLRGAADVLSPLMAELRAFFALWPCREVPPQEGPYISLHCGRDADGLPVYRLDAPWLPAPFVDDSPACALCNLSIELVSAQCRSQSCAGAALLCLHAAAVSLDGACVLLLGTNRAGKSSLAARLLADGHCVYGDDLLGLGRKGEIHAFGLAPRLRLPLPPSTTLAAFAQAHAGSHDTHYLHLDPARIPLAPHGATAMPQALVLLQRRPGARPHLLELTSQAALLRLLPRFIMQGGDAAPLLERAVGLVGRVPVFVLRYDGLDGAATCLAANLAASMAKAAAASPPLPVTLESVSVHPADTDRGRRPGGQRVRVRRGRRAPALTPYQQRPGVGLLRQGEQVFLTSPAGHGLYRLNPLGQAIWALLENPLSQREATSLLAEVFPDEAPSRIRNDLARLFQELRRAGLVVTAR